MPFPCDFSLLSLVSSISINVLLERRSHQVIITLVRISSISFQAFWFLPLHLAVAPGWQVCKEVEWKGLMWETWLLKYLTSLTFYFFLLFLCYLNPDFSAHLVLPPPACTVGCKVGLLLDFHLVSLSCPFPLQVSFDGICLV